MKVEKPKKKESKSKVKVVSGDEGYKNPQMYKRLIIGLINNELFTMFKTDKGLNILDENFEIRESRKKDLSENERGLGRELFNIFRENATAAKFGGGIT